MFSFILIIYLFCLFVCFWFRVFYCREQHLHKVVQQCKQPYYYYKKKKKLFVFLRWVHCARRVRTQMLSANNLFCLYDNIICAFFFFPRKTESASFSPVVFRRALYRLPSRYFFLFCRIPPPPRKHRTRNSRKITITLLLLLCIGLPEKKPAAIHHYCCTRRRRVVVKSAVRLLLW